MATLGMVPISDAAERMGLSVYHTQKLADAGRLTIHASAGRRFVPMEDVARLTEEMAAMVPLDAVARALGYRSVQTVQRLFPQAVRYGARKLVHLDDVEATVRLTDALCSRAGEIMEALKC